MPEVIKTHDGRTTERVSLWGRFAKLAGALAVIAGAVVGVKSIVDVVSDWKPKAAEPRLRVGWLTVNDPKSLECVMRQGDTFRLQKEGAIASQVQNDCYAALKSARERPADGPQALGKSYFLYLENMGEPIETLAIYKRPRSNGTESQHRAIGKSAAIALCVGYEGRSGLMPSRMDAFDEIEVVRAGGERSVAQVPNREATAPRGVADCAGSVSWNYPQ